jgi:GT2 family glycosyltransferase
VRVTVVNNASTDGSADNLGDLPLPLVLIRNKENRGFAAACNQGAKDSIADYLLFLNPDVRLRPESLDPPIRFLQRAENASCGICGIQLTDEGGRIARSCARFPDLRTMVSHALGLNRLFPHLCPAYQMTDWPHTEGREVDHVIGAFYLVRRSLFEGLGGFDERFFVYLEDLDFSLRAKAAGFTTYYLVAASAFHRGGGTSEQVKAKRLFYSLQSRIRYVAKHFSWPARFIISCVTVCIEPLIRILQALLTGSLKRAAEVIQAYVLLWSSLIGNKSDPTRDR